MRVGQRYKLTRPVRAIETINGEMLLTTIQAGGIVEVVAIPTDKSDPLVDVLLEGRTFSLRAVLLAARAEEMVE